MRIINTFVLAMLILALSGCNGCGKQKEDTAYQKQIDSLNGVLGATLKDREADSIRISELNFERSELMKQDSILRNNLKGNSSNINENNKGYAKTNRFTGSKSDHITKYFTDSLR